MPQCTDAAALDTAATRGLARAGDRVLVAKWFDGLGPLMSPQRWQVLVFRDPYDPWQNYIKRLVGLPGEQVEIIDGDVFVGAPSEGDLQIVAKTRAAQSSLWMPYFRQDHVPAKPSNADSYFPRFVDSGEGGWRDLRTRAPSFDGLERSREEVRFVTNPDGAPSAAISAACAPIPAA